MNSIRLNLAFTSYFIASYVRSMAGFFDTSVLYSYEITRTYNFHLIIKFAKPVVPIAHMHY